jgi:CTP:molybdopterin cytidylyltransferase MocA
VRIAIPWAISVVNPHLRSGYLAGLAAAVEQVGAARWILRQVVQLADQAPQLADEQLRAQLVALAKCARGAPDGGGV